MKSHLPVMTNALFREGTYALLICFLLIGCSPRQYVQLDFLRDGQTKKEEVSQKLGKPSYDFSGSFAKSNVLSYRLNCKDEKECFIVPIYSDSAYRMFPNSNIYNWIESDSNLILLFEEHDILKRHNLIQIK